MQGILFAIVLLPCDSWHRSSGRNKCLGVASFKIADVIQVEESVIERNERKIMLIFSLENVVAYSRNMSCEMLQWLYYMVDIIQILLSDGCSVYQQESQESMGQHVVLWA